MKTNKTKKRTPVERELLYLFKDMYNEESFTWAAVLDAVKAFPYMKQDALNRNINPNDSKL